MSLVNLIQDICRRIAVSIEGRFPRGRCEPIPGRYFCHLTAMDGGNAGMVGNIFRPWKKTLASTCPRSG
ncbi:hypothetical protein JI62_12990 [Halomonas campaniensis]|uniref:Uncharacterized protein n=1 Tax=Halomonas campaniensis TaxID=213554 RepID=A0A246RXA5_9GAMM|nr:hypothetical protein JI62_12990 [Halomonas campaniensis]